MLFNSFEFLLFLPIVFVLYWFVFSRSRTWQNVLILGASYFFYGWWSWKFMLLLALSTALDFSYGFGVASPNKTKARIFMWLSVINNLGILGVFKYYNFFAEQFQRGFEAFGIHTDPLLLQVALPVGISFYTFHGMSYVFDIYRHKQEPIRNFVDYAVFVSFFPLLVAGPIERASHLLPQVQKDRKFSYQQAAAGCRLFLWGMFKKVVIADNLAPTVDHIFNHSQQMNGMTLVLGAIAFSFQIYGDFSGYTDIALGTAKMFGFELLTNFKFPYFSRDIAEFWRRWHVSLSSWFRDYLYIPLGGSRDGMIKAIRNTYIIFLVSGFWHGASWNFIIWGFIHACGFLPLLLLNLNRKHVTNVVAQNSMLPNLTELRQMLVTFTFVTLAWIPFRAKGLRQTLDYVTHMVGSFIHDPGQVFTVPYGIKVFVLIIPLLLGDWYLRRDERNYKIGLPVQVALGVLALIFLYSSIGKNISFIYFQF